MQLDHYSVALLRREIASIVGRHLDMSRYRVFFFGSRAAGTATDRSDIDVGIEGPDEVPLVVLGAIREEVEELPTLYSIDVVDFSVTSDGFKSVALRHTEPI